MQIYGRIIPVVAVVLALIVLLFGAFRTAVSAQEPPPVVVETPSAAGLVPGFTFYSSTFGLHTREYSFPEVYFTGYNTITVPKSETYMEVVLNTAPTANVTLPFASNDTSEGVIRPASLTFTPNNWNVRQRVTILSVDDLFSINGRPGLIQDVLTYTLTISPAISADPAYAGLDPQDVVVHNDDNDTLNSHAGGEWDESYFGKEDIVYNNRTNRTIQRFRLTQVSPQMTIFALCGPLIISGVDIKMYLADGTVIPGTYGTSSLLITGPYFNNIPNFAGDAEIEIIYPGIYPMQIADSRYRFSSGTTFSLPEISLGCTQFPVAQQPALIDSPPVGVNDTYTAANTRVLRVAPPQGVLANDTPSGEEVRLRPLRARLVTPPAIGQVNLLPDGSFTYTPTLEYLGPVTFTYLAEQNELLAPLTTTVTLNVELGPLRVINTNDNGPGSLRGSIYTANLISGPNTIDFAPALAGQTLTLTSGEIALNQALTIDGSALATPLTLSGNNASRIFSIGSNNVTIEGLTFQHGNTTASGGAILNNSNRLSLTNVTFTSNQAGANGGALHNSSTSPILTNVAFRGNLAVGNGGGMSNNAANPTLTNVTFAGNRATGNGGGMYNSNSSTPLIQNSIFWNNQDSSGVGTANASIRNVSSTPTIRYSVVQGSGGSGAGWNPALGTDGGNNIPNNPRFVAGVNPATAPTTTGNLALQGDSPAIDTGDNNADLDGSGTGTATISTIPTDLGGNPRLLDGNADSSIIVDKGAYEHVLVPTGVTLAAFTAEVQASNIHILWETASEIDTLGFNLHRSTDPSQVGERLNGDLIPAQGPGGGQGALYTYLDESVTDGTTYFYWLEDVDLYGATTLHGPVSATMTQPTALTTAALAVTGAEAFFPLLLATVLGALIVVGIVWRQGA
jgi:hypothetical protein